MSVRYDDSLPAFARLIRETWGQPSINHNLFLREASGQLTFILINDAHSREEREMLDQKAAAYLGAYVDQRGFALATPEDLFDQQIRDSSNVLTLNLDHGLYTGPVNLVDRRMVGADWLRRPAGTADGPARVVFASIKGGVGRSTALCVVAAELASKGRRVLAIDMDLEAPGLGNLLLPDRTLPEFGLLDYLVEMEVGNTLDDAFFADLLAPSWLGGGLGRVDVIPAIGQRSLNNPANVLSKLARAYLATAESGIESASFSDKMKALVEKFADPLRYECILIDARAGLHETTAAAVLAFGADVLFFGLDQPQTFAGYELLFAHLSTLPGSNWQSRLHIVQSKAPADPELRRTFSDRMTALRSKYFPIEQSAFAATDVSNLSETFDVEWGEPDSPEIDELLEAEQPLAVLAVLDDDTFRSFDPISDRNLLMRPIYSVGFSELLGLADSLISEELNKE